MYNDLSFDKDNNSDKIDVDFLAIKIGATYFDNPYYTIIYHPINSDSSYEGYGSRDIGTVIEWAKRYFIVKAVV